MAQGQQSAVADTPDTLPADFFDKKNQDAPDTLPGDFFEKKPSPRTPSMAEGSYQNRKSGPILNINESSPHTAARAVEGTLGITKEPKSLGDAFSQSAHSAGKLGLSILKDPLNAGKAVEGIATGLESGAKDAYQGLKRNDPRSIAYGTGEIGGTLGQGEVADKLVKGGESIGEHLPSSSDIGLALRTERGAVSPKVRTTARAIGTGVGAAVGGGWGAYAGEHIGGGLADFLIPERPYDIPTKGASVGASLPDSDTFYANHGKDLLSRGRQQEILDRKTARETKESAAAADSVGAKIFPEPRDPLPGDRPGAMWSVGREEVLPEAAQRGAPGAGDVLRNIGKPIIYTPREGVGYSPRGEFEAAQGRMQTPLPPEAEPAGLKRGLMTERRSSVRDVQGPDLMRTARAQQLREQLLDSSLSARDRGIIQQQLDDLKANPFERHEGGDINSMKAKKTLSREEAEANTAKRKEGRNKRFGGAS